MANAKQIDGKFLSGLTYRTSKQGEDGTRYIPETRDLTPADVLDWKDNGATIILVTADGRKYTVDKKGKSQEDTGKQ
jgi:hypothetical protein